MENSSLELLNDGRGNTVDQPNKLADAIIISSLLTVTPRLASLLKIFSEWLNQTFWLNMLVARLRLRLFIATMLLKMKLSDLFLGR